MENTVDLVTASGLTLDWFDFSLLLLIFATTWASYRAGLIREIIWLAGFLIGVAVAGQLYQSAAASLWPWLSDLNVARAAGFLVVLFTIWMLAGVAGQALHTIIQLAFLGWPKQMAGLVFGLVSGVMLAQVTVILASSFPVPLVDAGVRGSTFAPVALKTAALLYRLLPPEFQFR